MKKTSNQAVAHLPTIQPQATESKPVTLDTASAAAQGGSSVAINAAMHALTRRDRGGPSRSDLAEQQLPAAVPSRTWLCCGGVALPEEVALEELCVASELLRAT